MRTFLVLFSRELKSFFLSPIGYIVMFAFLFLTGFNFWLNVNLITRSPTEVTLIEFFFNTMIFWFGFVLIFPLITMRSYSEEFKMGTIEPLMTAPVTDLQVVMAKFCGALAFYCVLWTPSLFYFQLFQWITGAPASSSLAAYFGSYLMLFLIGMFYISVGCLASALTPNQIIAAVISFVTTALLFFGGLLGFLSGSMTSALRDLTGYFSTVEHMRDFSKGILDSRPIVFYLSMTTLVLVLTYHVFQSRRWRA